MSARDETEAHTRATRFDPALSQAGWGVVAGTRGNQELIAPGRIRLHDPKRMDELLPWTWKADREAEPKAA